MASAKTCRFVFTIAILTLFLHTSAAVAQETNFGVEPIRREAAWNNPPFGVTGFFSFAFFRQMEGNSSGESEKSELDRNARFAVTASYDTWFGGLRRDFHGDVLRIGNRPLSDDMAQALYIDIGLFPQEIFFKNAYANETNPSEGIRVNERLPVVAFGYSTNMQKMKFSRTTLQLLFEGNLGFATSKDDKNYFGLATFSIDIMQPFGSHLMNYGLGTGFGALLANRRTVEYYDYSGTNEPPVVDTEDQIQSVGIQTYQLYGSITFDVSKW